MLLERHPLLEEALKKIMEAKKKDAPPVDNVIGYLEVGANDHPKRGAIPPKTRIVWRAEDVKKLEATGEWHVVTDSELCAGGEVDYGK